MSNYTSNVLNEENQNTAWSQVVGMVDDGWTILDVGCSSGNLGEFLINNKKCKVDGIEIDNGDAKIAKKKLRQVEVFNIESEIKLKDVFKEKYDAILLIDVIEHLVYPVKTLEKLKSLLKPEGVVIFSIPNMAHISVRLALMTGDFTYTSTGLLDKTHLHFYTGKEIRNIFNDANYEISMFNCTSVSYPQILLEKKLTDLGLEIKNKELFKQIISTTNGNVYQYIGTAIKINKVMSKTVVPIRNPHEKDFQLLDKTIIDYQNQIRSLHEEVLKLQKELEVAKKTLFGTLIQKTKNINQKTRLKK